MQEKKFEFVRDSFLKDLEKLVAIPSLPDAATSVISAPFGKEIRNAFDCFASIAKQKGFVIEDDEGYAISAQIGEGEAYIGVLGHLDVVEAGDLKEWNTPPFELHNDNGMLYARGVNDDKGPLLAALYAAWQIHKEKLPLRYPIRIIAGGAEETTWECMEHYFKHHKQPLYGFSPDGNFPIVNGEKGILQISFQFPVVKGVRANSTQRTNYVCDHFEIEGDMLPASSYSSATSTKFKDGCTHIVYEGKSALSRNPQRGENALFAFARDFALIKNLPASLQDCVDLLNEQFLDDFYGRKSGIYSEDKEMGTTSVCPMSITCNEEVFELCVDIRYVRSTTEDEIMQVLSLLAKKYHARLNVLRHKRMLFVEEDSELIQALKKAYYNVMKEDADVLTKGGASYARVLDCGVAFGATFPQEDPKPHMPNECMPINSLLKACEIYYEALYELAVDTSRLVNN